MERKDYIDTFGAASLIGFSLLMAFNQVVIKVVNDGLQPVFFAGVRSAGAVLCIWLWLRLRGQRLAFEKGTIGAGFLIGSVFAIEFVFLFLALDLTTVIRTSVIFYSMPVWLALAAHFLLPGERLTGPRALGLALALAEYHWRSLIAARMGARLAWPVIYVPWPGPLAGRALHCARAPQQYPASDRKCSSSGRLWFGTRPAAGGGRFRPTLCARTRAHSPLGLAFQIVVVASAGFTFWFWLCRSIHCRRGIFQLSLALFGVIARLADTG
jgi:uncharacterized membrane protein